MPLNPKTINTEILHWTQNKANNKVQAATAFLEAYNKYALEATCGGFPITNVAAIEAAKKAALPVLLPGFYGAVMPVWAGAVVASITTYWTIAVTGAAFGPTVVPPVAALPEPVLTGIITTGLSGLAGANEIIIAKSLSTLLDTWTRTITAIIAGTPTPLI